MFYYGPEEYYWGNASMAGGTDAVAASANAADNINRRFSYDDSPGGAIVDIGGLQPGANDTWHWTLLLWDSANESWRPWAGSARELGLTAGSAIAWCPNDTLQPTPNPLSEYPWPMFRCTAMRQGESLSPAPLTNLTWWTARLEGLGGKVVSSPCVAGGRLFLVAPDAPGTSGRARVVCLDDTDGRRLWQTDLPADALPYSSPAYASGRLFVAAGSVMRALDARKGSVLWEYPCNRTDADISSSPVVDGDKVLFSDGEGLLHCLDLDGESVWEAALGARVFLSSPALLGDRIVAGTEGGRVLCLRLSDGGIVWDAEVGGKVRATPTLSTGGYAFVEAQSYEGDTPVSMNIYSVFMRDGSRQWNASYPPAVSSPASAAGGLYLGTDAGLAGHHPDRGVQMWGIPAGPIRSSPAVARGYVYFSTDANPGTVGCARVGGFMEWSMGVNDSFFSSPVVADGRLFAASENGTVYCLGRPPRALVTADISAPARASEGAALKVKALLNNAGEAPAVFTVRMTVDGRPTGAAKGPTELQPGQGINLTFEWNAAKGAHVLGLAFNGTNGTTGTKLVVGTPAASSNLCAVAAGVVAASSGAALAPLVAWFGRRGRR
jgi:outer membrane protein assembly factor BamB